MVEINFSNIYPVVNNLDFNNAITEYCLDWKNYSTYAHNFYIVLFWIAVSFGILNMIFPINIYWEYTFKTTNKFLLKHNLNKLVFEAKLFNFLREITLAILLYRIFQIYYISKIYLGGL